jgi:hypothetical protein
MCSGFFSVAALTAADAAARCSRPRPVAALPAGTVESLLKPENKEKLVDILTCARARSTRGAARAADPRPRATHTRFVWL